MMTKDNKAAARHLARVKEIALALVDSPEMTHAEVSALFAVSRPTAVKLLVDARTSLGMSDGRPGKEIIRPRPSPVAAPPVVAIADNPPLPKRVKGAKRPVVKEKEAKEESKQTPRERRDERVRMIVDHLDRRGDLIGADVCRMFGVSPVTGTSLLRLAQSARATGKVVVVGKVEAAPPPTTMVTKDALTVGIDMTRELFDSANKLKKKAHAIARDLDHARFFVLGCPKDGAPFPGFCQECGEKEAAKIDVMNQPRLLQVGYGDIARLHSEAIKTEKALVDIVSTYNDVLSQCYSYEALEKFISNVRVAIQNVCPEYARELAVEMRRLQSMGGGNSVPG